MSKATIFFVYSCVKSNYSFIQNYVNYANIAWASTSKSKLERLYSCQNHTPRVICHTYRYTHESLLVNDMKSSDVFQLNIFNFYVLCINVTKI